MYSTIECTMLCGWTTTCTWSGRTSKSQRASMISSPLFISVAESTVIFAPIFQVGCRRASATVASASFSFGHSRNGPPDAVRMIRWTSLRLCPARHWKIALCSESTGRSGTLCSRAAAVIRAPAITRVSLLASAMGLPAWMAAIVGRSPAPPTSAESTMSEGTSAARVASPSGPRSSSGSGGPSARASRSTAPPSSSATSRGEYLRQRSASRSTFDPRAASPATLNSSGNAETISSVRRPTDPVAPSSVSDRTAQPMCRA